MSKPVGQCLPVVRQKPPEVSQGTWKWGPSFTAVWPWACCVAPTDFGVWICKVFTCSEVSVACIAWHTEIEIGSFWMG